MRQMSLYKEFKSEGKHKKKTQIILCHTSREAGEYLASLKFRYNGKYDKVPHYLIKKNGEVLQLLQNTKYSNFFDDEMTNKNAIIVSLENLGWLEKEPLKNSHINWIGDIYNQKVFERKWRDYFFWQPYVEEQLK